jgi:hypothetical protein
MKPRFSSFFQAFVRFIGIHEALFLLGFSAFFIGIRDLWSMEIALTVCGAILMIVAIASILASSRKSGA